MKETIWSSDIQILDEHLKKIKEEYPNFSFYYDWKYNPQIELYLKKLVVTSYQNDDNKEKEKLKDYIQLVEHFLVKLIEKGYITGKNITRILKYLNDGFKEIRFLPEEKRGSYGYSHDDVIEINPDINLENKSPNLTPEETTMLYMFREIAHKILKVADMDVTEKYCMSFRNIINEKGKKYEESIPLGHIHHGFLLIQEALCQELAELLTYDKIGKPRPEPKNILEFETVVASNFDNYGIFEKPTVDFGKTLCGCGTKNSDSKVILNDMIKRCLDSDSFSEEIISEYNAADARLYLDLFFILQNMGNVLNAKYESIGERRMPKSSNSVRTSLQNISKLAERNENYFEHPQEGLSRIDFDKYIEEK